MSRIAIRGALSLTLLLSWTGGASGQVSAFLAASGSLPTGRFADVASVGAMVHGGGVLRLPASKLSVDLQGFWGRVPHELQGNRSQLYGAVVGMGYTLATTGPADVEAWVGLGGMVHERRSNTFPGLDASRSGLVLSLGPRARFPAGPVEILGLLTYSTGLGKLDTSAYPTRWVTLGAGVLVPLGS